MFRDKINEICQLLISQKKEKGKENTDFLKETELKLVREF